MESNINNTYIKAYSRKLSEKLINEFFVKKQFISGPEVSVLSPIKQINYFILLSLFGSWKKEFDNLKSPYFNYEDKEVKEAASAFMNVLSRHIHIAKSDLKPLLEEAIAKTLVLIFSPYDFYIQEIRNSPGQQVEILRMKDLSRYIKINGHLLQAYIEELENRQIKTDKIDRAEQIFNEVCEQFRESPDEFDGYLAQFNDLVPLSVDDLYEHTTTKSKTKAAEPVAEKIVESKKNQQILLDTLEVEKKEALVEIHEKKPVDGIRKSITINQRFMFEKELFNGDKEEFERVINLLDGLQNRKEALRFIADNYLKKSWEAEKDEVVEFLAIVNKRFPE